MALELFNTGTDSDGDAVTGNPGELHYTVEYFETPGQIEAPEAAPTPPSGGTALDAFVASNQYYIAEDGTSRWVTPYSFDTNRIDPVGLYLWTTTFNVPDGIDAGALTVTGQWSSDNQGVGIYLNGELTDNAALVHDAFQGMHAFTLTGLQSGANILQFLVFNSPVGGETLNPTALRVQFDSVTLGNASAGEFGLFATGVDAEGAAVSGSGPDLHYTVTLPDGGAGTAFVSAHPNYLPDSSISRWLMLSGDATAAQPVGSYVWMTHFTIAEGTDLGQFVLNGRWASDNAGVDILINGVSTSISHDDLTAFDAWSSFSLTGLFHDGDNVIQFVVDNAAGSGANPTALRVEFTSVFLGM